MKSAINIYCIEVEQKKVKAKRSNCEYKAGKYLGRKSSDKCNIPLLCKYQAFLRCKHQCFQLLTRVDAICYGSAEEQDYHFKGGHYSKWLSPKSLRFERVPLSEKRAIISHTCYLWNVIYDNSENICTLISP